MTKRVPFFLLFFLSSAILSAQNPKEIKFKSRDLEKVKAELNQKQQEKERLKKEAEDLSHAVRESETKIRNVETSLLYTKQKSFEVEQQLASTKNRHDQLAATVADQKRSLQNSMKKYYVASLLTSFSDPGPVLAKQVIRAQIGHLQNSIAQTKEEHRHLQSLVETDQVIRGEVKKQEGKLSTIRSGREEKERLLTKKRTRQEILEAELRDLQKTAEELASLIDVLRSKAKEEAATEKETRRQKQLSGQSPIFAHSLPWPLRGKIATRFGRQQHPALGTTFVSNGIVIATEEPSSVAAVADGKVLYAGEFMSYGPMTVIEHPGDWYTVYGHLAHWSFEKGQEVKKGDVVGMVRPTPGGGYETYFELRFYGKPTDPLPWLEP